MKGKFKLTKKEIAALLAEVKGTKPDREINKMILRKPDLNYLLPAKEPNFNYPIESKDPDMIMYKGPDGKDYGTPENLQRKNLRFIIHDAIEGRKEVAAGSGSIDVGVGYIKVTKTNANGTKRMKEVARYKKFNTGNF